MTTASDDAYNELRWALDETEPCRVEFDENGDLNDPDKWVGAWTNSAAPEVAEDLCAGCHVLEMCAQYAILSEERDFIWGGLTPEQRKEARRELRRQTGKARLDSNPKQLP